MFQLMSRLCTAIFILGVGVTSGFAQDGVAGPWELTLDTPQGANTVNLMLKLDGDKLTGDLSSPLGSVPLTGTSAGTTASWTANIEIQGMAMALGFTAALLDSRLNGTVKVGDFGEFPFTGKRPAAKPEAAASLAPGGAAAAPAAGPSGSVAGAWTVVFTIPGIGALPGSATLTQDGDKVSGTFTGVAGSVPANGTMTGNALKLEVVLVTPQGPMTITMTGDLTAEGLSGKATLPGLGEADWKGTRQ